MNQLLESREKKIKTLEATLKEIKHENISLQHEVEVLKLKVLFWKHKRSNIYIYSSGSQRLVVGDPQNRIKHNYLIHMVLLYYSNTSFGDPKVSVRYPNAGRDPPVKKH